MQIFETLRWDHVGIRDCLDTLIEVSTGREHADIGEDWAEAFFDLKTLLNAHNRAEETVFYEAVSQIPNREDLADIKTEEHHQAEETLQDLETMSPVDHDSSVSPTPADQTLTLYHLSPNYLFTQPTKVSVPYLGTVGIY